MQDLVDTIFIGEFDDPNHDIYIQRITWPVSINPLVYRGARAYLTGRPSQRCVFLNIMTHLYGDRRLIEWNDGIP